MRISVLFMAAALTGCVSVGDVRASAPIYSGQSQKTVEALSVCVTATMQKGAGILVTNTPIEGGTSVIASAQAPQGITPFTIVDIVNVTDHREMNIRVNGRRPKDPAKTFSNLVDCL